MMDFDVGNLITIIVFYMSFARSCRVPAQDFKDDERQDGEEIAVSGAGALEEVINYFDGFFVLGNDGLDCRELACCVVVALSRGARARC